MQLIDLQPVWKFMKLGGWVDIGGAGSRLHFSHLD
jgi:hypothetical protein